LTPARLHDQDDLAVILIQKKNQLTVEVTDLKTEMGRQHAADAGLRQGLTVGVQSEIRKLQGERDSMIAKMQSAQARIKVQEQLDGLSVDAEVKASTTVRQHIKNDNCRSKPRKELSESSLDSRLAPASATRPATCRPSSSSLS